MIDHQVFDVGDSERERMLAKIAELQRDLAAPIPMFLTCPGCGERHIDEGEFSTKPHHTHACQSCGLAWRPAVVSTVGVRFLPGFKNEPAAPIEETPW